MKLVAISDTHHKHDKLNLPEGDVLIHCGDFMGSSLSEEHFYDFITWFGGQPHKHKIMIPGNHDGILETGGRVNDRQYSKLMSHIKNLNINCKSAGNVTIEGLNFGLYSYTAPFNGWYFQEHTPRFFQKLMPCDILVSHGPNYGLLDTNEKGVHCGSKYLLKFVEAHKPRYHFHGHIHEAYGHASAYHEIAQTTEIYNCAILNENYKVTNKPTVVDV